MTTRGTGIPPVPRVEATDQYRLYRNTNAVPSRLRAFPDHRVRLPGDGHRAGEYVAGRVGRQVVANNSPAEDIRAATGDRDKPVIADRCPGAITEVGGHMYRLGAALGQELAALGA